VMRRDLVARVAVAQRITVHTNRGKLIRFRFFADGAFFSEMLFCNTEWHFSAHAIDRYSERVGRLGRIPWNSLLLWTVGNTGHMMKVNGRERACVFHHPKNAIIALTVELTSGGFIFTTCLTANEIRSLETGDFSVPLWFHFGRIEGKFMPNWNYKDDPARLIETWKKQELPVLPAAEFKDVEPSKSTWHFMAHHAWQNGRRFVLPPGMEIVFAGNWLTGSYMYWPTAGGRPNSPNDPPVFDLPAANAPQTA